MPIALLLGGLAILTAGGAYVSDTAVNNWTTPSPPQSYDPNAAISTVSDDVLYLGLGLGVLFVLARFVED